jgi:hypothetical protein
LVTVLHFDGGMRVRDKGCNIASIIHWLAHMLTWLCLVAELQC